MQPDDLPALADVVLRVADRCEQLAGVLPDSSLHMPDSYPALHQTVFSFDSGGGAESGVGESFNHPPGVVATRQKGSVSDGPAQ